MPGPRVYGGHNGGVNAGLHLGQLEPAPTLRQKADERHP